MHLLVQIDPAVFADEHDGGVRPGIEIDQQYFLAEIARERLAERDGRGRLAAPPSKLMFETTNVTRSPLVEASSEAYPVVPGMSKCGIAA